MRGLINFSGGLRQDECSGWQKNLVDAFGDYGQNVRLPSLWFYGDNDSVWQGTFLADVRRLHVARRARTWSTSRPEPPMRPRQTPESPCRCV